jgi:hypothetical protein
MTTHVNEVIDYKNVWISKLLRLNFMNGFTSSRGAAWKVICECEP